MCAPGALIPASALGASAVFAEFLALSVVFIFFQLNADTQQGHCLRLITKHTSSLCPAPQPALLNLPILSQEEKDKA